MKNSREENIKRRKYQEKKYQEKYIYIKRNIKRRKYQEKNIKRRISFFQNYFNQKNGWDEKILLILFVSNIIRYISIKYK